MTKKAPYKGGLHRCAGLRRRQENQGQEAACSRRYIRPAASRCCPSCERPRSRWSHSTIVTYTKSTGSLDLFAKESHSFKESSGLRRPFWTHLLSRVVDFEDEGAWLRHRVGPLRAALRISREPRVEGLRDLIIDAEKRLEKIDDEQLQIGKIPAHRRVNYLVGSGSVPRVQQLTARVHFSDLHCSLRQRRRFSDFDPCRNRRGTRAQEFAQLVFPPLPLTRRIWVTG